MVQTLYKHVNTPLLDQLLVQASIFSDHAANLGGLGLVIFMGILAEEGEELGKGVDFEAIFGHLVCPFDVVFVEEGKDAH